MKGIMIQGCSSDAGKSFIATAICRVLSNKGYLVCPFKSQNMSNNSYVTADGGEIGRAQGEQARAARQEPTVFMNPILLKPQKTTGAEIILFGQVYDSMNGREYQQKFTMNKGLQAVDQALEHIRENFELIVIEGAGSPAEINLNDREIVNMRIANRADVPVLLVVDVNRGGSFASVVGTLELVGEDRQRIKGIIFNNFRGDVSLFADGAQWIEDYTGIKVVGIMPHLDDVILAGEDSLSINFRSSFKE
ncbi:MAG: cobyric acid synthase, partial [Clostridiales bacterium]